MRKRTKRVYLIVALLFGLIGFFIAETGQILGFFIGALAGVAIVFFASIFPRSPLPDDSWESDSLDGDEQEEKRGR